MFSTLFRPTRCVPGWLPALALCGAAAGFSARAELTLDQALRLAQDRSQQLAAQDFVVSAAREMAAAAAQWPDPVFKAGLNSLPIDGPDRFSLRRDSFTMLTVGVVQELTRQDKLVARAARFDREAEAAQASHALLLANLRRDTALAWLNRHYQQRLRELLQAQRDETALQIDAAEAAYRSGRGALADVFAARSAVAQIDDRLRGAALQISTAITRLARWVGPAAELALAPAPVISTLRLGDGDLEAPLAQHPQIGWIASQQALAQADAQIAQSAKTSDWSVELSLSQRGSAYSNMVSLNFSIPLQWDAQNRQDRAIAAKQAVVAQWRAQREEAAREQLADAQRWRQQWQGNQGRLAFYDSTLLPLTNERTLAATAAYRGGGGPLLAVLEARRLAIEAGIERLRLEADTAELWAQLEYLVTAKPTSQEQQP